LARGALTFSSETFEALAYCRCSAVSAPGFVEILPWIGNEEVGTLEFPAPDAGPLLANTFVKDHP
jgi:hypothetical protein